MKKNGSIDEIPPNAQPELQSGIRIARGRQIVPGKPEPTTLRNLRSIEIFNSHKGFKAPDLKVNKSWDIRQIRDSHTVLVEKLAEHRRIIVRLIGRVVFYFYTGRNVQISEKISLERQSVPGKNEGHI